MYVLQPGKIVPDWQKKRSVAESIEHRKNGSNPPVVDRRRQRSWIWTMTLRITSATNATLVERDVLALVLKKGLLSALGTFG